MSDTAFFADNDIIASACMKALKEYGYKIPKQMFGQRAVTMPDQQIHGNTSDHIKMEVSTTLIERKSVVRR